MEHPAFADAGQDPGVEIWTIDQFEPLPVDQKLYGKFYNGDCYIVLKTSGSKNSSYNYDAHFWIGSEASQDKMGTAAILTVTLDDMLGGKAVQHREVQLHESSQFLGYFKPAIRYLEGGTASGFTEVETNAGAEKRLLRLTGSDNMRIEEVPPSSSSLTREHCFILEVDHDIFVLMPDAAKATQRRKIISVANTLRDDYHNGRASIEIIDEFSSDEDIATFFEALGSGSKEDIADDETDGTLRTYERDSMSAVYLYKVLTGDSIELVAINKPYKQKHLSSGEIYILDTPCSGVYIWMGRDVEPDLGKSYHDIAQQYLLVKGYPTWVNITKVTEGSECSNFKQYFNSWDAIDSSAYLAAQADAGYFSEDADEAAAAKQIGKSAAAVGYMPGQGDGSIRVTRYDGDDFDVTCAFQEDSPIAVLYQGVVYVVDYIYTDEGEERHVVYVWIGAAAQPEYKKAGVALAAELEEEYKDLAIVVSVPQGKEPKHFLSLFKGNLAILYGSNDNRYAPTNTICSYDENGVRFFKIEGTEIGVDMRATQVPESADLLEDDDVFVLETALKVFVWNGKESDPSEQEAALSFVKIVVQDKEVISVLQGEEPEDFWAPLGGPAEDREDTSGWRETASRRVITPMTLTAVNVTVTGKIKFEELAPEFSQKELSEDGVYILDGGEELYLWQGSQISERLRRARSDIIREYVSDDGLERTVDTTLVVGVKQGREPKVFKKKFPDWDDAMWENQSSYEDIKNEVKAANSK